MNKDNWKSCRPLRATLGILTFVLVILLDLSCACASTLAQAPVSTDDSQPAALEGAVEHVLVYPPAQTNTADSNPTTAATNPISTATPADIDALSKYSLPPEGEKLKKRPQNSLIYQVDAEPLGERSPLLLIHGGNGETQDLFRWEKVIPYFKQNDAFCHKYKIYLLRYNSSRLFEHTVPESSKAIIQLYHDTGNRQITIMALSMGGNIAQEAMVDPEVDKAVKIVFAMATPFHGSPLFSSDWFQYSLYKSRYMAWLRLLDSLDYRVYFEHHKNYQQNLKWDNIDSQMPDVGNFKSKDPLGPKGDLTPKRDDNPELTHINAQDQVNKKKFITHAGYLVNPFVLTQSAAHHVESALFAPFKFVLVEIPAQLGHEQAALKVLNQEISKVKSASPDDTDTKLQAHMYDLNDGITPVSSALFLPASVCKTHPLQKESDLQGLQNEIDVRHARVFRNIDHVTFVDGKPPHHGSSDVKDELHPNEGSRPIFEWMLQDVMSI